TDEGVEHHLEAAREEPDELGAAESVDLRRRPRAAAACELGRDLLELRAQHLAVELFLRAVVVVPGGEIDAGALGDLAGGGGSETACGEQLARRGDQSLPGAAIAPFHEQPFKTLVSPTQEGGQA